MKTFRVFVHPAHGLEAVKSGFSWPAFFITTAWMLELGLWRPVACWFSLYALIATLLAALGVNAAALSALMLLSVSLTAGISGNRWRERQLHQARYQLLRVVLARNAYEAMEQAFGYTRLILDIPHTERAQA